MIRFYASVLLTSILSVFTTPALSQDAPASPKALAQEIGQLLSDPQYSNALWAVKVIDLASDNVLLSQNEHISMMPASNAKLYTTAAALDQLGPSFRYETSLFSDGPVERGVLKGNLIVRGSGDPTIGGRYDESDPVQVFRTWARALKAGGIDIVEGDIIGDDDLFDELPLGYGWSWDDEPYYYSAEIGALTLYDNAVRFVVDGMTPGMPGAIKWSPFNTSYIDVSNGTVTVHPDSSRDTDFVRLRNFNDIEAIGEIPAGYSDTTYVSISNPTKYFTHVLRDVLLQEGIAVMGKPVDVDELSIKPTYEGRYYTEWAVYQSPPLSQIIDVLNKESQNLYAELLLRTLGTVQPALTDDEDILPGSAEMGVLAAMRTYAKAGADTSRMQLFDGSGLSRMNLVTADMTAAILSYMWHHPYGTVKQAYYASLPEGGVDGTLEDRFEYGLAHRNVRAKTGTLTSASALSGYITSAAGTPLLFVLMCNNYTVKTSAVRRTQNAIVNVLAEYQQ